MQSLISVAITKTTGASVSSGSSSQRLDAQARFKTSG